MLNPILEFLDEAGVIKLWSKIKERLNFKVDKTTFTEEYIDKIGQPEGIATLDSDGRLKEEQIPQFKTINGESVVGVGNITIDVNIYQIVEELPTTDINPNKIYLVLNSQGEDQNVYTEYGYINGDWEKLGEYKASIEMPLSISDEKLDEILV